jgi:hypothetical protein
MHSGVNDTAVILDLIFQWLWLPLKRISIEKTFIGKLSCTIPITFTQEIWGLTRDRFYHSDVIDTAVTKIGDFIVDFIREFETIFKKTLTRVSGAKGELFDEKKIEVEILVSASL